jgi:hypothetical protein
VEAVRVSMEDALRRLMTPSRKRLTTIADATGEEEDDDDEDESVLDDDDDDDDDDEEVEVEVKTSDSTGGC